MQGPRGGRPWERQARRARAGCCPGPWPFLYAAPDRPGSWRGPWQAPLGRSLRASAGVCHSTNVPVTEDTGGLGPPDPLGEGFCVPGSRTYTHTTHTTHQTHNTYNTHTRKLQDLLKTFSTKAGENFLKKSNASRRL